MGESEGSVTRGRLSLALQLSRAKALWLLLSCNALAAAELTRWRDDSKFDQSSPSHLKVLLCAVDAGLWIASAPANETLEAFLVITFNFQGGGCGGGGA